MSPYRVVLTPAARRQLDHVKGSDAMALRGVVLALAVEPRPRGARRLQGLQGLWRIRVVIDGAPWRVVYQLRPQEGEIVVTRIVRRDEATYRRLTP
ncbi:MAG: type II toxin-antitoxin system RelE family toxin [Candidatus Limnocylindrales bacterium]